MKLREWAVDQLFRIGFMLDQTRLERFGDFLISRAFDLTDDSDSVCWGCDQPIDECWCET